MRTPIREVVAEMLSRPAASPLDAMRQTPAEFQANLHESFAELLDAVHRCEAWERQEDHVDRLLARAGSASLFLIYGGHSSLADWLLHLIVASVVWHLVGALVYAHPLLALAIGAAALVAIALLRRGRSVRS